MPTGDRVPEPKRDEATTSSSSPALPTPSAPPRALPPEASSLAARKAPSPVRRFPSTPGLSRRPGAPCHATPRPQL
nr:unnamed protein product [Digitaria exilis]